MATNVGQATVESTSRGSDQVGLDEKRGNLTRRATLWNQFDALMRAQGTATPDIKDDGKAKDGDSPRDVGASDSKPNTERDDTSKQVGKTAGHDAKETASKRMDKRSESSERLLGKNSVTSKSTSNDKNHNRKLVETTGIGQLDSVEDSKDILGRKTDAIRTSVKDLSISRRNSKKALNSSSGDNSKKTSGGHSRRQTTDEKTSKSFQEARHKDAKDQTNSNTNSETDGFVKGAGGAGSVDSRNRHSRSRSTGDCPGEHEVPLRDHEHSSKRGEGGSAHSGTFLVSGSRPHSQESGYSRADDLLEPLALSRPGSSGSEYNHRSDVNLSESLNQWVSHLTTDQAESPKHSPRAFTPSVSPLPGDIPSYGKPIMPGYKPNSTKQESLVLPRPARAAEPLHPNPSLRDCIPIMPRPAAVVCFVFNILVPGLGTFFSALSLMCCGRARPFGSDILSGFMNNCWAALLQLLSTPVLLVGWIWSIIWGLVFLELSARPHDGMESSMAGSSTGSRASDLSRNGRSSRASLHSRAIAGRSSTVTPMASTTSQERPIITLRDAPVIISHNANAEPHTSQLPQVPANQSNHRYHRMMQRHQRAAAATNNDLPFLRAEHMDDFVRLSASVFGIAMVQNDGDAATGPTPGDNQKS